MLNGSLEVLRLKPHNLSNCLLVKCFKDKSLYFLTLLTSKINCFEKSDKDGVSLM
jgi:ABC-type transport system involved in cytochrome c biogenesis permease component